MAQLALHLRRCSERLPSRADRLMGFLCVLDLLRVLARRRRQVVRAVQLEDLRPGRVQCRLRQRRRVGAHVGDVAVLVQLLGHAHRALRREAELAAGLLLEGRRHERRVGRAAVWLLLDRAHVPHGRVQTTDDRLRPSLIESDHVRALQQAVLPEVLAGGQAHAVEGDHRGLEALGGSRRSCLGEAAVEVPVARGVEPHAGPLALDDESGRDALDPPGGEPRHDLLPEDRGDLVAVEPVEDAPSLLRVDEVLVEVS